MNVKAYLPTLPGVTAELLAVLAGTIGAAYIVSKFPKLQQFVMQNSVTIRPGEGPFIGD